MTLEQSFIFHIGKFECLAISDGAVVVPDMVTPKQFDPRDPSTGLAMDVNCLVIRTGRHNVLVDTGCGTGFGPIGGHLFENMAAAGIKAGDIDTVVITHAHGDHIGGNADSNGKPAFPNARYVMHRKEWDYWTAKLAEPPAARDMNFITRNNLPPIKDRLALVDKDAEIVPGIKAVHSPGHTPGGLMLTVSSASQSLLCIGDLVHHEAELTRFDLYAIFDVAKDEAVAERKRLLPQLADSGMLVYAAHLKFPGLARFARQGDRLVLRPVAFPPQ